MSAAPSLALLMVARSSPQASGSWTRCRHHPVRRTDHRDRGRTTADCSSVVLRHQAPIERQATTPSCCSIIPNPWTHISVTRSRPTDRCSQAARHAINKGNSKLRLRCVQLAFCIIPCTTQITSTNNVLSKNSSIMSIDQQTAMTQYLRGRTLS